MPKMFDLDRTYRVAGQRISEREPGKRGHLETLRVVDYALTPAELEREAELVDVVYQLHPIYVGYSIFRRSHAAISQRIGAILEKYIASPVSAQYVAQDAFIDMSEVLANYVASAYGLISILKNTLHEMYGADHEQSVLLKARISARYKRSFAFRFVQELRNYSQHHGLPANKVSLRYWPKSDSNLVEGELHVPIEVDRIFTHSYKWPEKVRREIQSRSPHFQLLPMIEEHFVDLSSEYTNTLGGLKDRLYAVRDHYEKGLRATRFSIEERPVFAMFNEPNDPKPSGIVIMPIYELDQILKSINERPVAR